MQQFAKCTYSGKQGAAGMFSTERGALVLNYQNVTRFGNKWITQKI